MGMQSLDGFRQGMQNNRLSTPCHSIPNYRVSQQGNRKNMVQVGVADQNMIYLDQCLKGQIRDAGSSINQHPVIKQKRGSLAALGNGPGATQNANFDTLISQQA
jgi:hypothetical protein